MSPTISNAAWSGTALISACISRVDVGPGQFSIDQAQYPLGNDLLGPSSPAAVRGTTDLHRPRPIRADRWAELAEPGSLLTLRWRGRDSNHRSQRPRGGGSCSRRLFRWRKIKQTRHEAA